MTLKIRSVDCKRLNTGQSDDPRIFFWVGYEVSHQEKTRGDTILRREVGAMLAQTAPTKAKFLKLTPWLGWFRISVIFSRFSIYTFFGQISRKRTLLKNSSYLARRRRRKTRIFHSKNDFPLLFGSNLKIFSEMPENFRILYISFLDFQNLYIRKHMNIYNDRPCAVMILAIYFYIRDLECSDRF